MTEIGIIGGGIVGLTSSFVLQNRLGCSGDCHIEIFEKDELGSKSTSAAGCGLRTVYNHPTNIELSIRGVNFWSNAVDIIGDVGFRRNGYLFMTEDSKKAELFRNLRSTQRSYGLPCQVMPGGQANRDFTDIRTDNYKTTMYSPVAALATPEKMVSQLSEALDDLGVRIRTNTEVKDLHNLENKAVIETKNDQYKFDYVINAAGGWSSIIAQMIGSELPTRNVVRRLSVLDIEIKRETPLTVDIDTGAYILPSESGDVMAGGHILEPDSGTVNPDHPAAFSSDIKEEWNSRLFDVSSKISEILSSATVTESWTGLYTMTDSRIPILDKDGNIIHVTGFSGHGIMHAPGAAAIVCDLISGSEQDNSLIDSLSRTRETLNPDVQF